ncbi:fluoride efflux transporter CrcB [Halomonas sp. ND22Bw]|uniref:Fluoride-specific ion channel FluC n=1 Tax=Halomonas salina TaxID=42565 RepID=A0ABR4WPU9_9GAMM|nr:fluoride efflux transporter CrcB [Halomonas salina]KGE76747.1 camphor resistance protein CrcB [Halomonas salina]PSJ22826.1 fluoride efflux transporter CrcB [Halomonas sp. ND22Bw]
MSVGILGLGLVAMGGALGGMARLAVGELAARWLGRGFPWGTLAVNVLGCLAIGALAPALGWPMTASPAWSLLAVGGLGGFTTVSSFSLQTLTLWQEGRPGPAVANVLVTLVVGVAAAALGWWLAGGGA